MIRLDFPQFFNKKKGNYAMMADWRFVSIKVEISKRVGPTPLPISVIKKKKKNVSRRKT